jgi:hypothetical protein
MPATPATHLTTGSSDGDRSPDRRSSRGDVEASSSRSPSLPRNSARSVGLRRSRRVENWACRSAVSETARVSSQRFGRLPLRGDDTATVVGRHDRDGNGSSGSDDPSSPTPTWRSASAGFRDAINATELGFGWPRRCATWAIAPPSRRRLRRHSAPWGRSRNCGVETLPDDRGAADGVLAGWISLAVISAQAREDLTVVARASSRPATSSDGSSSATCDGAQQRPSRAR